MNAEAEVGQVNVSCGATVVGVQAKADLGGDVIVETPSPFLPTEGVIKVWNSRQGFITRVGHKYDLFFHRYGLAKYYKPAVGDRVRFDVASSSSSGRVYAINVRQIVE